MKNNNFYNFLKPRRFLIILSAVIICFVLGYFYFGNSKIDEEDIFVVKRTDLTQTVNLSGKVKPANKIELGFEKSGKISLISVDVGDKISKGDILALQENDDLSADLEQAKAVLKKEESKLAELYGGTRKEEIVLDESKVEKAQIDLVESRKDLENAIKSAYTKSDDVIRNTADQFFNNPRSYLAEFSIDFNDSGTLVYFDIDFNLKLDIKNKRIEVESLLNDWRESLEKMNLDLENLEKYGIEADNNLVEIKSLLDKMSEAVNSLTSYSFKYESTVSGYKTSLSGARTIINSAIDSLNSSTQEVKSDSSNLIISKKELALKKAGTLPEKVIAQEAAVEEVRARVSLAEAQMLKTFIRSPIDGVVTKRNAEIGEITNANTSLFSIISDEKFEIESFVPEISIAKIKIGNSAKVTFDAYDLDVVFEAVVSKIDPAETIIDGISNYRIILDLLNSDERIKPGMTANLEIMTDKKERAIVVPLRSVASKNRRKTIQIIRGKNIEEVEVQTGIKGSDGGIEIIYGIEEGNKILIPSSK